MTLLHDHIHADFVKMCKETIVLHTFPDIHDREHFLKSCFLNYHTNNPSLRLTTMGNEYLKQMYDHAKWELSMSDVDLLKIGHTIIKIHRRIKAPYYWNQRYFYMYSTENAMEYELVARDFEAWINLLP